MKILFVILTCAKYSERKELQKEWIKYISAGDSVVYLDEAFCVEYDYNSVPVKYSTFIKNCMVFNEFDWVFFCDDDTFLFPKKLHHLLHYFDCNKSIMIGRTGMYEYYNYCSGGAGFAVSKKLILKVRTYLFNNSITHFPNSDTSFGRWAKITEPDFEIIDRIEQFQTQHLRHPDNDAVDIDSCISFHYCGEYDYNILKKYLKYAISI